MEQYEQSSERREFLLKAAQMLGIAVAGGAAVSIVSGCETDVVKGPSGEQILDVTTVPVLTLVGGAALQTFGAFNGGREVIVIRTTTTTFAVYTAVCTHQQCLVNNRLQNGNIYCACHASSFSVADGRALSGPATGALRRYETRFDAATNRLTIVF
jgi:cytochrome b6-f complex iron-sulfur subunit